VFHEGADTYSHLMAFSGAGSILGALLVVVAIYFLTRNHGVLET
jgi:VIT1/CCC1 family predicted Fe2+/Mn2+ transporter